MSRLWHQNAVIYQIDPTRFFDSNADGWGDLRGIVEKLDYVESLGATAIWLTPFYLSPRRDNGYDVENHTEPDPRIGSLEDVEWLIAEAEKRGIRVIIELVAQHTSDAHDWFQEARKGRDNPFHDYYLWRDTPGPDEPAPMFPTIEPHIWRWDEQAQRYYRHLFYHHEPDLNLRHPDVIQAVDHVLRFWADKGVAGFRVDAASHMVEQASLPGDKESGYRLFNHFYDLLTEDHPDMILLGEVDVNVSEFEDFFGGGERLTTLLNFWINKNTILALAREEAAPLVKALNELPMPPANGGYCFWLRNHDELDLEDLEPEDYDFVMEKYAPDPDMRIYGRGIRRRLAPMLDGNERQQAMAHALLFSLPGTPVVRYGAEIGMGDLLSQPERESVRTPMQWKWPRAWRCLLRCWRISRISSPAASVSASRLRGRSSLARKSSFLMRRRQRWMSPCRRRSCRCLKPCRMSLALPICLSPTIWRPCAASRIRSRCCAPESLWSMAMSPRSSARRKTTIRASCLTPFRPPAR